MAIVAGQVVQATAPAAGGEQVFASSGILVSDLLVTGAPIKSNALIAGLNNSDQNPPTENVALQVTFGAAQLTPSDPVNLLADGTIQFNEAGTYFMTFFFNFGRTSATQSAQMDLRGLINGAQVGATIGVSLDSADQSIPHANSFMVDKLAGPVDEITWEIARDAVGPDEGGLLAVNPSVGGWNLGASASVRIWKLTAG